MNCCFLLLFVAHCIAFQNAKGSEMECTLKQLDRIENWFVQSFEEKIERSQLLQKQSKDADPNIAALESAMMKSIDITNRKSHDLVVKDLQRLCLKRGARFDRKTRECF